MKRNESLANRLAKASQLLLFAVPIEAEIGWEHNIFVRLWNCYISDKEELFYLVINPGFRPLFIRNSM